MNPLLVPHNDSRFPTQVAETARSGLETLVELTVEGVIEGAADLLVAALEGLGSL